ncbi:DUF5655 domain-containing protein [Helicobacter cappadocius]|uniref:DUF5655 domain-containing protein n=1 Tax=Helicobacter cappadocius TaxID=3063998 RepID=A0AA90PRF5_9HELI|nr:MULTISPECIES: DUF5655 domain-containing protein [unclassified Helicobacter]MDO7253137.1 DUF5655 domain-containing protein [Helicobacter sp. faydin-H75]MDP2538737.1 DUF5655 domain-containing protein [Helicobacter sp. faydin-H76]
MENDEFINEIKRFRKNRILKEEIRELIRSEEETKLKLINPFLKILGYDVEEPGVLVSEDIADFRNKKGKKVDYIAYKEGRPIMLIETKYHKNKLCHSTEQLDSYFNTKVRDGCHLALLTNGVEYRFFSDLNADNTLDEESFFTFDLRSFSDKDIEILQNFIYNKIDPNEIQGLGKKLKYYNKVLEILNEEIKNPSNELISLFVKEISGRSRITPALTEEFRGYFKRAFEELIGSKDKNHSQNSTQQASNAIDITTKNSNFPILQKNPEQYTEDEHLKRSSENVIKIYKIIKAEILKLDNQISVNPKKQSIAFVLKKNIVEFVILQNKIKIYINLKYLEINDWQNKIRDVSNVGKWASGDCEFIYENIEDTDYLLSLIKQSYNKNK